MFDAVNKTSNDMELSFSVQNGKEQSSGESKSINTKSLLFKGPLVNLWPKSKLVESNFFSSVYRYPCIEQTHSIHATQAKRKTTTTTTTTIKHTPNYWPANSLFPRLRAVHRISARALVSCKLSQSYSTCTTKTQNCPNVGPVY